MRFAVETWAPEYGGAASSDVLDPSEATVAAGFEIAPEDWSARTPAPTAPAERILFVDGVQRIDARVWIECGDGRTMPGLAASYAAGVVRCDERAEVVAAQARRGLFTAAGPDAEAIRTPHGDYPPMHAAGESAEQLTIGVQQRMGELEIELARDAGPCDLLIVDGPLFGRQTLPGAVGYIKSHHASYLPPPLDAVIGRLAPGERTPLFLATTFWTRVSWYMRLPGGGSHPWAGIVRCEVSADLPQPEIVTLADRATAALPRFASSGHKDKRAPQNLYPIGGLERELRRRLGDQGVLMRALLASARVPAVP